MDTLLDTPTLEMTSPLFFPPPMIIPNKLIKLHLIVSLNHLNLSCLNYPFDQSLQAI